MPQGLVGEVAEKQLEVEGQRLRDARRDLRLGEDLHAYADRLNHAEHRRHPFDADRELEEALVRIRSVADAITRTARRFLEAEDRRSQLQT